MDPCMGEQTAKLYLKFWAILKQNHVAGPIKIISNIHLTLPGFNH